MALEDGENQMAIEFERAGLPHTYRVLLDGKMVGVIRPEKDKPGFYYNPKGSKAHGETFQTVAAVMQSLREA